MKMKMLTAVSAIALMMAASPAMAGPSTNLEADTQTRVQSNNEDMPEMPTITEREIERGWENTKTTVSDAVDSTVETVKETVTVSETDIDTNTAVSIKTRTTAKGIIGKDIYNADGETVASIEDVLVNERGEAETVILRDGGLFGMGGKLVALDYDSVITPSATGDMLMPVSEATLDSVAEFSYDTDATTNMRTLPAGTLSVSQMLDGHLHNNMGEEVADIDNITFVNGQIEHLIVSYNEILGMGGDTAALMFGEISPSTIDGETNFSLTEQQSADFEAYTTGTVSTRG